MDNKNLLNGIIILVIISLGMNVLTCKKAEHLEERVQALNNQNSRIDSSINSGLARMNNTLSQIKEQEEWISPITLEVGKDQEDTRTIILSWQIKEYPVGAPVTLYYRLDKEQEFIPITANSSGGGYFTADLHITKTFQEPDWNIYYSGESIDQKPYEQDVMTEKMIEEKVFSDNGLNYYVTMQNGPTVLTSGKNIENISRIMQTASPLDVCVHYRKGGHYDVTVLEIFEDTEIKIQSAALVVKESHAPQTEVPFTRNDSYDGPQLIYQVDYTHAPAKNTTPQFTLRVVYDNGEIVEKQI